MHRCIYGIVHPDDHLEIKKALEGKTDRSDNKQEKKACSKVDTTEKLSTNEISPISFLCRMKCFSGNTAGFMKLHCSGKIRHIPELGKANHISPDVAIIYCQPFMLTGNDFTHEIKQDVFWSKHDMDLTIRELDKKSLEMTGYETDELNGKSLYSIIHPEDLFTCAACHKTLTESMEIQTMYLRLQTKGGTWMWFHSRGKVICKNSKKFSIVFTHCPVREEDSTFIQQESALRQKYAITDLIYMHQFGLRANSAIFYSDMTDHGEPLSSHRSSQSSLDDEIALVLQGSMSNCPSSWHATLERHSPVLPSSHVAHKITQREKQIQYAEFKRRKQTEQTIKQTQSWNHTTFSNNTAPSQVSFCLPEISFPIPQMQTQPELSTHSQFGVTDNAYGDNRQFWFSYYGPPTNIHDRDIKHPPWHYQTYQADCGNYFNPTLVRTPVYNFPPSPPPSPDIHHRRGYERKSSIWAEDQAGNIYHGKNRDISTNSPIKCPTVNYQMPIIDVKANLFSPYAPEAARTIECMGSVPRIQSQANIRFSMRYHTCLGNREGIEQGHQFVNPINPPVMPQINQTLGLSANNIISIPYADNETETNSINDVKPVLTSSQSCAFASGCCVEPKEVQYDIEASIHMKIVENERKAMTAGKEVLDLPSIGSFLEYLNEG
ncbi:hypothetical protein ACJMK2_005540 [Sinanodonta woodiana]|uniref:PAS domain-containing protein n=1 Tax=Sinanodonta woodiana TaxID=1069815 RepID=A0ABD3VQD3_SINWO